MSQLCSRRMATELGTSHVVYHTLALHVCRGQESLMLARTARPTGVFGASRWLWLDLLMSCVDKVTGRFLRRSSGYLPGPAWNAVWKRPERVRSLQAASVAAIIPLPQSLC